MDRLIYNPNQGPKRIRLTREELLAGKCFPDEEVKPDDPRFKSPNLILERTGTAKPVSNLNLDSVQPTKGLTAAQELARCKQEIEDWLEYRDRVEDWKRQVYEIIHRMHDDTGQKQALLDQIKNYKELLRLRDEQIRLLKSQLSQASQ